MIVIYFPALSALVCEGVVKKKKKIIAFRVILQNVSHCEFRGPLIRVRMENNSVSRTLK